MEVGASRLASFSHLWTRAMPKTMNRLAAEMAQIMARMQAADEQAKTYGGCGPRLNPEKDPKEWLGKPDGPAAKLANEKPPGETIPYDELIKRWTTAK